MLVVIVFFIITAMIFILSGSKKAKTIADDQIITKSLIDESLHKIIRLENGLDILIISDSNSPKCAAALAVGVGSFTDEKDTMGLAHLTEHMIFLGSKKYPKPGLLEKQIEANFGYTNAYTSQEFTNYFFEINKDGYEKALDIFSAMLDSALLSTEYMDKEINAVSSENDKNLNNDLWRQYQLIKSMSNPESPNHLFSTGNNVTLRVLDKEKLNEKMKAYYQKYYIPRNMRIVLYCKFIFN